MDLSFKRDVKIKVYICLSCWSVLFQCTLVAVAVKRQPVKKRISLKRVKKTGKNGGKVSLCCLELNNDRNRSGCLVMDSVSPLFDLAKNPPRKRPDGSI